MIEIVMGGPNTCWAAGGTGMGSNHFSRAQLYKQPGEEIALHLEKRIVELAAMGMARAGGQHGGFAIWIADAAKESGANAGGGADTGAGNRREQRDLHSTVWAGAAEFASRKPGATGESGNRQPGGAGAGRRVHDVPDAARVREGASIFPRVIGVELRYSADEGSRGRHPLLRRRPGEWKRIWTAGDAAVPRTIDRSV